MFKYLSVFFLTAMSSIAYATDAGKIMAIQQALIAKLQDEIEKLKPVYLSDLDLQFTNVHSMKKDGVSWLPETGYRLGDSTVYAKGLQLHPPANGVVQVAVRIPRNHTIFSAILVDITSCGAGVEYTYRFSTKKGRTVTPVATYPRQMKTRIELGVADAEMLIVEIDSAGTNNCDHSTLVDAKFIN